jgi:phenylalanine-4-hydroxylase
MQKAYDEYEQLTWRRFYAAIEQAWALHADLLHPYYRDNLHVLAPFRSNIPTQSDLDGILEPIGWRCSWVAGYAPPWEVARMLARRTLPISRSIRPADEIFFGREPDLLHDIFGHLPSLMDGNYRRLLARWAEQASRQEPREIDRAHYHLNKVIAQSHDKVPDDVLCHATGASEQLSKFSAYCPTGVSVFDKLYFWIFEFGITETCGRRQVLGAGLLSSLSEFDRLAQGGIHTRRLDVATILSNYSISSTQNEYLIVPEADSYDVLIDEVAERTSQSLFAGPIGAQGSGLRTAAEGLHALEPSLVTSGDADRSDAGAERPAFSGDPDLTQ